MGQGTRSWGVVWEDMRGEVDHHHWERERQRQSYTVNRCGDNLLSGVMVLFMTYRS